MRAKTLGNRRMKRILFVGDVKNWAMHHIYLYMENEFKKYYDVKYVTFKKFNFLKSYYFERYDLIYIMYALLLQNFSIPLKYKPKILTGVHCHWEFCDHSNQNTAIKTSRIINNHYLNLLQKVDRVAAVSRLLYDTLNKYIDNVYYVPHAIDTTIFYPEDKEKIKYKQSSNLIVGWAQNETSHKFKRRVKEIREVCEMVEGVSLIEAQGIKSKDKLRRWYNNLDCYICFSILEGGPLPVFEAMACGVPCISTPVGQVPEIIEDKENGFIIKNKEKLLEVLKYLKNNKKVLNELSIKARKTILEKKTPKKVIPYYINFFEGKKSKFNKY